MLTWIVLGARPKFPAGLLRGQLALVLPSMRWTCGEDDDGSPDCAPPFARDVLVTGRAGAEQIQLALRSEDRADGRFAVKAVVMGSEDPAAQDRVLTALAATFATLDRPAFRVRFGETAGWLDAAGAERAARMVVEGEALLQIVPGLALTELDSTAPDATQALDATQAPGPNLATLPFDDLLPAERSHRLGIDVLGLAARDAGLARALYGRHARAVSPLSGMLEVPRPPAFFDEGVRRERLPTLAVLAAAPPEPEWTALAEGLAALDPDGDWQVETDSPQAACLAGRGCAITLGWRDEALPAWMVEEALARSFWCRPGAGLSALRRHRGYMAIACDLDTATAPYAAVRQCAKVLALAMVLAAREEASAGIYNAATRAIFTADQLPMLAGPLAGDEVPIQLFVWTAFPSTEADAVSLSTAGLLPFVGREVEAWNAPGTLEFVGEKLNGFLRYLLVEGPVVGHGDTVGESSVDMALRIGLGASRDISREPQEDGPVPVYLMEFAGPAPESPRPDTPPRSFGRPAKPPPGSFGRKGL